MASATLKESERTVFLHPLVILNISDHFTRTLSVTGDGNNEKIYGALFGVQTGLTAHIYDSFELIYNSDSSVLDMDHLNTKRNQYAQVFPDYELLGWYAIGQEPSEEDMIFHKKICEVNESPLFLMFDPNISAGTKELPVSLYESVLHMVNETPTMVFVLIDYKIETAESERITVDVANESTLLGDGSGKSESALIIQLGNLHNSISMLTERVRVIQNYLLKTKEGKIPKNHQLLREISGLCNQLPIVNSETFQDQFFTEYNDTLLVTYLATITKGAAAISTVMEKVSICNTRK